MNNSEVLKSKDLRHLNFIKFNYLHFNVHSSILSRPRMCIYIKSTKAVHRQNVNCLLNTWVFDN